MVLDTVGGSQFEPCLRSFAFKGRQVVISSTDERRVDFGLIDFYHSQHCLFGLDTNRLTGRAIEVVIDKLRIGFEQNKLTAPETQFWPLEQSVNAYNETLDQKTRLKNVTLF